MTHSPETLTPRGRNGRAYAVKRGQERIGEVIRLHRGTWAAFLIPADGGPCRQLPNEYRTADAAANAVSGLARAYRMGTLKDGGR